MEARSLKNLVDVHVRADREATVSTPTVGYAGDVDVSVTEAMPDAAFSRRQWRMFTPPYKELPGVVSKKALEQHLVLYAEYLQKAQAVGDAGPYQRKEAGDTENVTNTILHELYFSGLSLLSAGPALSVSSALLDRWGSVESWWSEMTAAGTVAKGWAVTAVSYRDPSDVQVFALDSGDDSCLPPGYVPVVVIDVNEHAYWMDHGTNKAKYLGEIVRFLNWEALDERFTMATR